HYSRPAVSAARNIGRILRRETGFECGEPLLGEVERLTGLFGKSRAERVEVVSRLGGRLAAARFRKTAAIAEVVVNIGELAHLHLPVGGGQGTAVGLFPRVVRQPHV